MTINEIVIENVNIFVDFLKTNGTK